MVALYRFRPVANGVRTDHPTPGLPFVDDAHIPVDDPEWMAAIGRGTGTGTWARDVPSGHDGWTAYATDPVRPGYGWIVRRHRRHGRSVVLFPDAEARCAFRTFAGAALLFRAGGYWWDGSAWFRPAQLWHDTDETFVRSRVPASDTVSAHDLLAAEPAAPDAAAVLPIVGFTADVLVGRWIDHLALWARSRAADGRALHSCVVTVAAAELSLGELVGVEEIAARTGIAATRLRHGWGRDDVGLPPPQSTERGRDLWARPVVDEWVRHGRRSIPDAVSRTSFAWVPHTSSPTSPPASQQR